ncbi:MAG: autotransporter-associated beta strand repeat-containing protein, partial [Pirellulales bacterium]
MRQVFFAFALISIFTLPASAASRYWDIDDVIAGAGGPTPTGTWNAANVNWTLDSTGSSAASTWVAGDTAVFAAGTSASGIYTVTVSGTQSIGGITVEEGTVTLSGGTLSLAAGGATITNNSTALATISSAITAGQPLLVNGTANVTLSGVISGAGTSITKSGANTLTLSGANNTYTGSGGNVITVTGGEIIQLGESSATAGAVSSTGALPATAIANYVVLDGGKFTSNRVGLGVTFLATNKGITLNGGGGTLGVTDTTAGNLNVYGGVITGSGNLTFAGPGILSLTNDETYTGATNITGGTLRLRTSVATGSWLPNGTALTISSGANFDVANFNETIGSLAGSGNVNGNSSGAGTLNVGGNNNSTTFSGQIQTATGAATTLSITKSGTGIMTIQGFEWNNTGAVTINGGSIRYGNSAAGINNASAVTVAASASLDMNSINDTIGTLAGAGNVTNNNGTTGLKLNGTGSTTFSGSITGTSDLTKNVASTGTTTLSSNNTVRNLNINAGIFTLSGSNTVTGSVSIVGAGTLAASSGRINFNNNNAVGSADVFVTGVGAEISNSAPNITTANTIHLDGGAPSSLTDTKWVQIESTSGNSWNISGKITGTGGLIRDNDGAGTLTLSGDNDFSGGFYITNRTAVAGSKNAFGTGTVTIGDPVTAPATAISVSSNTALTGTNAIANATVVNRDFSVVGTNDIELSGNADLAGATRVVT